jgi:hypothetical protein
MHVLSPTYSQQRQHREKILPPQAEKKRQKMLLLITSHGKMVTYESLSMARKV